MIVKLSKLKTQEKEKNERRRKKQKQPVARCQPATYFGDFS